MARRSASGTIRVGPHPRASLRVTIGNLHRDNNFDALRLVAATLVILSHSWTLTGSVVDPVVERPALAMKGLLALPLLRAT